MGIVMMIIVGAIFFAVNVFFQAGLLYLAFLLCKVEARFRNLLVFSAIAPLVAGILVVGGLLLGGGLGFVAGLIVAFGVYLFMLMALTDLETLWGAFFMTLLASLINGFIGIVLSMLFGGAG